MPSYLLLPFLATILVVFGFMLNKRAMARGADAWAVTLLANSWAAIMFSVLLLQPGEWRPWQFLWQPLVIAVLYILGQLFLFLALERGDVSVAAPIFSVKVLSVAVLAAFVAGDELSAWVWCAAVVATVGVALVHVGGSGGRHQRLLFTVVFALLSAATFSLFDVVVQIWSGPGQWDVTRLLPLAFGAAAVMSLGFLPLTRLDAWRQPGVLRLLLLGTMMIGMQAFCIVIAIGTFGDVARINVVYALRGLWGVILAWSFARVFDGGEAQVSPRVMSIRLVGAALVTIAVVLALLDSA